jgi:hypothetical protein
MGAALQIPAPTYTPTRAGLRPIPTIGGVLDGAGQDVDEHGTPRQRAPNPIIKITPPEGRDSFFSDDPVYARSPATRAAGAQTTGGNFSPPDADVELGEGGERTQQHRLRLHDRYEQVAGWFATLLGKLIHWRGRRGDGEGQ